LRKVALHRQGGDEEKIRDRKNQKSREKLKKRGGIDNQGKKKIGISTAEEAYMKKTSIRTGFPIRENRLT